MTVPTYVGANAQNSSSGSTITPGLPGSEADQDYIIIVHGVHAASPGTVDIGVGPPPSPWTTIVEATRGPDEGTEIFAIYGAFVPSDTTGPLTAPTIPQEPGDGIGFARSFVFRNVRQDDPYRLTATVTGTGDSHTHTTTTSQGQDRLAVLFHTAFGNGWSSSNLSGEVGGDYTTAQGPHGASGPGGGMALQTASLSSAGSITGGSYSSGASLDWIMQSLVLKPQDGVDPILTSVTGADGLGYADDGEEGVILAGANFGASPGGRIEVTDDTDIKTLNVTSWSDSEILVNMTGDDTVDALLEASGNDFTTRDITMRVVDANESYTDWFSFTLVSTLDSYSGALDLNLSSGLTIDSHWRTLESDGTVEDRWRTQDITAASGTATFNHNSAYETTIGFVAGQETSAALADNSVLWAKRSDTDWPTAGSPVAGDMIVQYHEDGVIEFKVYDGSATRTISSSAGRITAGSTIRWAITHNASGFSLWEGGVLIGTDTNYTAGRSANTASGEIG